MVERRTRALFEFGIAALGVFIQIRLWKAVLNENEPGERPHGAHVSPRELAFGALYRIFSLWLYDRDVGEIRTNRRRGVLFSMCTLVIRRRLLPQTEAFKSNFGVGGTAGMVVYRLRYGVLHPLPGEDD